MSFAQRLTPQERRTMSNYGAIIFTVALVLGWLLCRAGVG